jgi:hypothetical protein
LIAKYQGNTILNTFFGIKLPSWSAVDHLYCVLRFANAAAINVLVDSQALRIKGLHCWFWLIVDSDPGAAPGHLVAVLDIPLSPAVEFEFH